MEHIRAHEDPQSYTIFNEITQRKLELPRTGIWYTHDLREAREMQQAAQEYLDCLGLRDQRYKIRIMDVASESIID